MITRFIPTLTHFMIKQNKLKMLIQMLNTNPKNYLQSLSKDVYCLQIEILYIREAFNSNKLLNWEIFDFCILSYCIIYDLI